MDSLQLKKGGDLATCCRFCLHKTFLRHFGIRVRVGRLISLTTRTWTAAEEKNTYVRSGKAEPLVNLAAKVFYVLQMSEPGFQLCILQRMHRSWAGKQGKEGRLSLYQGLCKGTYSPDLERGRALTPRPLNIPL